MDNFLLTSFDKKPIFLRNGKTVLAATISILDLDHAPKYPARYVDEKGNAIFLQDIGFLVDWSPDYKEKGWMRRDVTATFLLENPAVPLQDICYTIEGQHIPINRTKLASTVMPEQIEHGVWLPAQISDARKTSAGWMKRCGQSELDLVVPGHIDKLKGDIVLFPRYADNLRIQAKLG